MNIALIFAGGSGVRMGAGIPKQFLEINSMPVLVHTVRLFQWHTMQLQKEPHPKRWTENRQRMCSDSVLSDSATHGP